MAHLFAQLALILALALGSPVASCCRIASMIGHGLGGVPSGSGEVDVCCACCDKGAPPVEPQNQGPSKPCECGPAKSLLTQPSVPSKVGAMDFVSGAPLGPVALLNHGSASPVTSERAHPPPRCSLVALHCALTI